MEEEVILYIYNLIAHGRTYMLCKVSFFYQQLTYLTMNCIGL